VLVLAIKPQTLDAAAQDLAKIAGPQTLVLSIMAGKTIANIKARLPRARAFVRVIAQHARRGRPGRRRGIRQPRGQRRPARVDGAADARGRGWFDWLDDEALIDAVTAISGSGPAYIFALVEAMAKAGEAVGLPPDVATRLARATVEGAGELLYREPAVTAAKLRETSPRPPAPPPRARRAEGARRIGRADDQGRRRGPSSRGRTRRLIPAWRIGREALDCKSRRGIRPWRRNRIPTQAPRRSP